MATWIQSLSWTLIYGLGQGLVVYASLWLILKLLPGTPARVKYHLSLTALSILLAWFAGTWWRQYHLLSAAYEHAQAAGAITIYYIPQALQGSQQYSSYGRMLAALETLLPWLPAFYFTGLTLMLLRLSGGMMQLFSLKRNELLKADAVYDDLLITLKKKLNYSGAVQLFISAKAQVPMVIGFLKPLVLMPAAAMTRLSSEELETILLHELAHIKRHDYLVNILQTVVETILFFNPFVWMISSITRREREHSCDDLVLAHSREPLNYATALASLASNTGSRSTFTVAASGQENHLFNRIKRIMEMKKNPFSYSRMAATILIVAAIGGSVAWVAPGFAQAKKEKVSALKSKAAAMPEDGLVARNTTETGQQKNTIKARPGAAATVRKDKAANEMEWTKADQDQADAEQKETTQLIQRMSQDGLISEVKGFVVEKKLDKLYIDGQEQASEVAGKYLAGVKKENMTIRVFPLAERFRMHPNQGFIQNLIPVSFQSGCVDYGSTKKKPGC